MIAVVPEAGGDAGVGALRMLKESGADVREVVLLDALEVHPAVDLFGHERRVVVPAVKDWLRPSKPVVDALRRALVGENVVVMPSAESMTVALVRAIGSRPVRHWLPPIGSFGISRDKMLLGKKPYGLESSCRWSGSRRFGKPRFGIGSRGARLFLTRQEAEAVSLTEPYIFQEELPGPDMLVDVVDGMVLTRRIERQRGGADVRFRFVRDGELEEIAARVAVDLGVSVANVQFRRDDSGVPWVIDVGLRFSGAICGSLLAGVNPVSRLLGLETSEPVIGAVVLRRFEEVSG